MNKVIDFIVKYKDEILVGVIVTVCGSFAVLLFQKIAIIKRFFSPKPLPEPKEQAVYLNIPKNSIDDNPIGRDKLLNVVSKKISDGKKKLFIRKSIVITGEEGIGKTTFCYRLFKYDLHKYPIYLGWIECNGKQSIFDIIKNTFEDLRFRRKGKDDILNAFMNLNKLCVLFVDQINQFTPLDELEELSHCSNVILILSGLLRRIDFADDTVELPPLSDDVVRIIFQEQSGEDIDLMNHKEKYSINRLLNIYVKGNPSIAIMFANARTHYEGKWENMLNRMESREYDDNDYLKNILRQLYKISELNNVQKSALSKLSAIQYEDFTKSVFELLDISDYCVRSLCNTYWLKQNDSVIYVIDKIHCTVISKFFLYEINLKNAIDSINESISVRGNVEFRWISLYIEDILKRIRGYSAYIMEEEFFFEFAYYVALNYRHISNYEKCLEWIELCQSKDAKLSYKKASIEFSAKSKLVNTLFSPSEVKEAYFNALEKAKVFDDFEDKKVFLMQNYCNFLIYIKQYSDAMLLCKEYFETNGIDLRYANNCSVFYRYLDSANTLDDKESLKQLVNEKTIQALYQNENVEITAAWSFGELGRIFKKRGDKESSDMYMRHMVVLLNKRNIFYDNVIKYYLKLSEEEFAKYMHSCNELLDSLNEALERKDAEALYIEGRYQEKNGNYDNAFALYEEAAERDSLRGMCSLALLYYRGQGESCDYDKARRYWEYCCKRGHRGSYYWLGILLLDTNYEEYDKELALQYLKKAAELGSERAKQKLLEFEK